MISVKLSHKDIETLIDSLSFHFKYNHSLEVESLMASLQGALDKSDPHLYPVKAEEEEVARKTSDSHKEDMFESLLANDPIFW